MSDPISTKTLYSSPKQLLARSFTYQLLSFLFMHPSVIDRPDLFKNECASLGPVFDELNFSGQDQLRKYWEAVRVELEKISSGEWISQYEACFGYTAYGPVPSHELEYGEEYTHRQPQQLGDIAAFYNAFGLKINSGAHERVDHISVECEFMQYLLFKEAYAWENDGEEKALICQRASRQFLTDHLGFWSPSFFFRLAKQSPGDLFKNVAKFAEFFIAEECRYLKISCGPHNLPMRMIQEKEETGCVDCSLTHGHGEKRNGE